MADVISESLNKKEIKVRETILINQSRFRYNPYGVVDPREILK